MFTSHTPLGVLSYLKARLAPLAAAVVVLGAVAAGTQSEAKAASWHVGWDGQIGVWTDASFRAKCSTTINADGTKTWTIEGFVNVASLHAGYTVDAWFGLTTSTGYTSQTYFDRTPAQSNYRLRADKRVYFESSQVSQATPQRTVTFAAAFGLWENGIRYLANAEYASHSSSFNSYQSTWGSNQTYCVLH